MDASESPAGVVEPPSAHYNQCTYSKKTVSGEPVPDSARPPQPVWRTLSGLDTCPFWNDPTVPASRRQRKRYRCRAMSSTVTASPLLPQVVRK